MAQTSSSPLHHGSTPCFLPDGTVYHAVDQKNLTDSILQELDISRLDGMVCRGLWLAGRIGNVRPLHRQYMLQRRIIITERLDMHLLWHGNSIFIKPLAGWILDSDFFKQHIKPNAGLVAAANGFLSTYARLINHQSDFHIAKDMKLLPEGFSWDDWRKLSSYLAALIADIAQATSPCSPRFYFGELRLSRVNMIYRYHPAYKFRNLLRGYFDQSQNYQSFLRRNFAWLLAVFVYVTVVLTAMQVGLGTIQLRNSRSFNEASYGFTVLAILLPLAAFAVVLVTSICLTIYNVRLTRRHLWEHLPKSQLDPPNKV